jgi:hypothetical protein
MATKEIHSGEGWRFECSVETLASSEQAWQFWTDVENWAAVDSSVEWVKVDGPFTAGARGATKPRGQDAVYWELAEIDEGKRAVIDIHVPGAVLRCMWVFEGRVGGGACLMQHVELTGEHSARYEQDLKELERGIPAGMKKLAEAMNRAAARYPNES